MNHFYKLSAKTIDQKDFFFDQLKGLTVLIVNVASECGLTPQYAALEKIYEKYASRQFQILAFPANNFGAQEPGTNEKIADFCQSRFGVKFQMMSKISVLGSDIHPVYKYLINHSPETITINGDYFEKDIAEFGFPRKHQNDILWNFEKFLINKSGQITHRFNPDVLPDHEILLTALEKHL